MAAVGTAPLPWCHFDTPPLVDIAADQLGLQWNIAGCHIHAQNHCSAHLIFGPGNSPQYGFFSLNWALNSFCSTTASPTSLVRSRITCSIGEIGCGG